MLMKPLSPSHLLTVERLSQVLLSECVKESQNERERREVLENTKSTRIPRIVKSIPLLCKAFAESEELTSEVLGWLLTVPASEARHFATLGQDSDAPDPQKHGF